MKRVLNGESGPDLTICSAAELSFRTLDMGTLWDTSPKLSSRLIPFWILASIPTNSASHEDKAVRLCFRDPQYIRLGP
eukprot:8912194-Prorocentrum_lima.AAC.1